MKLTADNLIHSLLLIRIGQTLGSDSDLARAIHALVEAALACLQ
jgi:hypothetical protein